MKKLLKKSLPFHHACLLFALFISISLSSCAKKVRFVASATVPAAEGYVKIKRDDNRNYALEVNVKHLASPEKLQPSKNAYVVWVETERNGVKNVGQLRSSSGFFSSTLEASLTAVTPFEPVSVFVTAEDRADVQYQGVNVVLRTRRF